MMKILTAKRSMTVFVRELKKAIRQRFKIIPFQERDILTAIDVWVESQPIIT